MCTSAVKLHNAKANKNKFPFWQIDLRTEYRTKTRVSLYCLFSNSKKSHRCLRFGGGGGLGVLMGRSGLLNSVKQTFVMCKYYINLQQTFETARIHTNLLVRFCNSCQFWLLLWLIGHFFEQPDECVNFAQKGRNAGSQ